MKRKILIPNQQRFQKTRKRTKKQKEERYSQTVKEILDGSNVDSLMITRKLNVCYLLADIMEGLIIDAESELKKVDSTLKLPILYSAERIRAHTSEMVRLVDAQKDNEYSASFGELSDKLKTIILNQFGME